MKNLYLVMILSLSLTNLLFCFGCKYIRSNSKNSQTPVRTYTKVTEDDLRKRLGGKNVQFIEKRGTTNQKGVESKEKINVERVDISLYRLVVRVLEPGDDPQVSLNEDRFPLDQLPSRIRTNLKERGVDGFSAEVFKRVTLAASEEDIDFYNQKGIYVENLETVIDALLKEGFDALYVSFANIPDMKGVRDIKLGEKPPPLRRLSVDDLKLPPMPKDLGPAGPTPPRQTPK